MNDGTFLALKELSSLWNGIYICTIQHSRTITSIFKM